MPGLEITLAVALATIVSRTCCGVIAEPCSNRAAAPTTCGVAIDVPLIVLVAVSDVYQDDVMLWPGAKMSTQVP